MHYIRNVPGGAGSHLGKQVIKRVKRNGIWTWIPTKLITGTIFANARAARLRWLKNRCRGAVLREPLRRQDRGAPFTRDQAAMHDKRSRQTSSARREQTKPADTATTTNIRGQTHFPTSHYWKE